MNEKDFRFIQGHFQHYYRNHAPVPPDLTAREFGFGWQKKIDYRHAAFASHKELAEFFIKDAPLFASYSTAYYQFPAKKPVPEKGYLGADLVFDLDKTEKEHDHQAFFCRECLRLLHGEALALGSMLSEDFGFSSTLVFSGQKGFHLHVRGDPVRNLSKDARRQISDYICAEGLDAQALFPETRTPLDSRQSSVGGFQGPGARSQGWQKRIHDAMQEALRNQDVKKLRRFGLSRKNLDYAKKFQDEALANLSSGNWKAFCDEPPLNILDEVRFVQTDRAVTYDLSRLIRLPESLHGSTGFRAKILEKNGFSVEEAVVFPSEPFSEIRLLEDAEFTLSKPYSLRAGRLEGVPLHVAIFLLAQGKATLP